MLLISSMVLGDHCGLPTISSRQNAVSSPPRLRLGKLIQMVGKNQGNGNAFFLFCLLIQVVDNLFFYKTFHFGPFWVIFLLFLETKKGNFFSFSTE